jgi:hypothetical protein
VTLSADEIANPMLTAKQVAVTLRASGSVGALHASVQDVTHAGMSLGRLELNCPVASVAEASVQCWNGRLNAAKHEVPMRWSVHRNGALAVTLKPAANETWQVKAMPTAGRWTVEGGADQRHDCRDDSR